MNLRRMTRIAVFAVVLCVCSLITVPFTVPFTLQTFGVACALLMLGGKDGLISVSVYLALGCLGLPVFSGFGAGLGHLLGPTGGYMAGFLLWSGLYLLLERTRIPPWLSLAAGLLLCYAAGTAWFCLTAGATPASALTLCVLPYLLPDGAKLFLALQLKKKMPNL